MNSPQEDALTFPFADPPQSGRAVEVAPGVLWIRLALPFRLDHVNAWALDGGEEGWTLVDTGLDDPRTRQAWEELLEGGLAGRPVHRIIATHFHPDHIGLAGWLTNRTGAGFATSLTEWLYASLLSAGTSPALDAATERFYERAGLDSDTRGALLARRNAYRKAVPHVPVVMSRLRAGDRLTVGGADWQVLIGAGHTAEPVCLYSEAAGLLIPGDQLLPSISPNISVWPSEPDADPLADYLGSFAQLRALPEETLVLPSHGLPFRGLRARLDELGAHHEERLADVLEFCSTGRTAVEVAAMLFRPDLDTHQMVFAMGETIAHLNHLWRDGRLTRRLREDGVDVYRRAG
ncbi:MBL fold metallo-hydrolase [Azospirillum thermophilum]|uniref:MBL fold metallo-hydrolase n=1 Tax=Azospirillum thermophilum TaxID=2202148 RepID=A0A2S2CX43_9PROT|nr:MBL fold metallo-hydrolase [Azospirillum thermophilum]AWK89083.1 MBL fold metallo-hydrolase [Azospirillum thermophilum]